MGYLSLWLCVPAVIGVCCDLLRSYRNDTIDEDEYTPFFSVFMFLWAVLFTRYWNRYEISLAYQWGTYALSHSHYERQHSVTYNANFVPTHTRISPVTGEQEMYHPTYRRRLRYIGSGVVTIGMLCIAFIVMIVSLNVQGFISPQLNPGRWKNIEYHPFYIPYLDTLNEKGNIFDSTTSSSWWRSYIPAILHMVCIMVLNTTYSKIATSLTQWENHETHQDYANALVLKRFLFEMFDCYVSLFYLAFFERDMDRLRLELVTIFNIDIVRRIATETVVPTIMKKLNTNTTIVNFRRRLWCYRGKSTNTTINNVQDNDDNGAIPATASVETRTDHTTFMNNSTNNDDEYEEFDDFMELMIQFGYITLFASAYPAAAFIVMIHNYFEIRSEIYKLCKNSRRPRPYRCAGIGQWKTLFTGMVWCSALTNCLLVGFTSEQLMQYLPELYIEDKNGFVHLVHDKGYLTVFLIFGLEHGLLLLGLLICALIPMVPEEVEDKIDHLNYVRSQKYDWQLSSSLQKSVNAKKQN